MYWPIVTVVIIHMRAKTYLDLFPFGNLMLQNYIDQHGHHHNHHYSCCLRQSHHRHYHHHLLDHVVLLTSLGVTIGSVDRLPII